MPVLVVQQGHVPRTRGATGGPYEQQVARAVGALIASMVRPPWTVRLIDADEPTSRYAGDAFVSLHCDASSNPSVRGASVGYRTVQGAALAAAWKAAYAAAGWPGSFRRDNYTPALAGYYGTGQAVKARNPRAVIVEQGFTTNPDERDWLLTPDGQRASARAVLWAATGTDPAVVKGAVETPTPPPSEEDDEMALTEGARGNAVRALQRELIAWNASRGRTVHLNADGVYGPYTTREVRAYQQSANLPVTGKADGVTLALLFTAVHRAG